MHNALSATVPAFHPALIARRDEAGVPAENVAIGTTRAFAKDEEIYAEGDPATYYFRVLSGAVRTSTLLTDGRRQIDAFHVDGDVFGLERGEVHRFAAEAVGEAVVIAYRRCSLDALAAGQAPQARLVVAATLTSLERAQQHMILLGRKSAMEKVATFLLEMAERMHPAEAVRPAPQNGRALDGRAPDAKAPPAIELPMSRSDIGDYLGLTIETVSRTLTQLERDGVIALPAARRNVVLRNRTALRRLSA